jgi:hypothetical protein
MRWVYAGAVADVFQACRALRWWLVDARRRPRGASVFLHGESFGGGLAVPAAAKLDGPGPAGAGRPPRARAADDGRLALAPLSTRRCGGSGAEIRTLIERESRSSRS